MYLSKVKPTGVERRLDPDDVILSKTDLRGVITDSNQAFIDYAGYSREELYGSPHSLIRHPEMPRAVFKLLWRELLAGRELFVFVKNLAKDGRHYWVIAQVLPELTEGVVTGYISFRRCPGRRAVETIDALYRKMLAVEVGIPGDAGMDASYRLLVDTLKEMGKGYDEMVYEPPAA
jgi:PAS domain S-box-containing protein